MKKYLRKGVIAIPLLCALVLSSCQINSGTNGSVVSNSTPATSTATATDVEITTRPIVASTIAETNEDFTIITEGGTYTKDGNTYKITSAGTYTLSGKITDGMIYIEAGDNDTVELDLNGVSITSTTNSPIYAVSANKVKIKALENTGNYITDNRDKSLTDSLGTAAIYAECDLDLVGKGSLTVIGNYNNGVHTKDDLQIKNQTLSVTAYDNALKGNDSIEIVSGTITAISTGGDAVKTTNSDLSKKGNQRGTITISGGEIRLYACEDTIDAAYDVVISNDAYLELYTGTYSTYSSTHASSTDSKFYIRIPSSYYNNNYRYACYFYNTDGTYSWVDATYSKSITTQNGKSTSTYYLYELNKPTGYTNMALYRFESTNTENQTTSYNACTSGGVINTNTNMYYVNSINSTKINGGWTNYNQNNNNYSAKAIKADNEITISDSAELIIKAQDDALHANYGTALENNTTGKGNVNVSGGKMQIIAGDDGIHADNELNITGGTINITNSHEGLEGNVITVSGGTTYVYANDDGVNATSSGEKKTPLVNVTGGYLDVTVGSGDTDGIDANGNYSQSGGYVITRNPGTDTSGNMAALDIDGTFTITGGTFIALGCVCKTPSNYNYVLFGSTGGGNMWGGGGFPGGRPGGQSGSTTSFAKGDYSVSNTNITFSTTTTYYGLFIASDELVVGTSYTLTGGTAKSWTQSSKATTISN